MHTLSKNTKKSLEIKTSARYRCREPGWTRHCCSFCPCFEQCGQISWHHWPGCFGLRMHPLLRPPHLLRNLNDRGIIKGQWELVNNLGLELLHPNAIQNSGVGTFHRLVEVHVFDAASAGSCQKVAIGNFGHKVCGPLVSILALTCTNQLKEKDNACHKQPQASYVSPTAPWRMA